MQDFARYNDNRNLTALETRTVEWTPEIPSVILGILVGIFVTIISFKIVEYYKGQAALIETPVKERFEDKPFVFEFYDALKNYEVPPRKL
ncbi:MAG: hypothetical protein FI699_09740 [SAR202 cluster bacterium]|nr:hypothetical protein [SAR202 cluster bacterium]|tara:strand:+ start:1002 stop:1271 length:270 start_codon:yes stop_codon:yes gene_type:complete